MQIKEVGIALCIAFSVSLATAQSTVTTSQGGSTGTVPVFTSGTNIENSVITQSNDNVGIGTTNQFVNLNVNGEIQAVYPGVVGPDIEWSNPSKTTNGTANRWDIYNMTGGYGNSLQFWDYDTVGCATGGMCNPRLTLMDNGNVGIGTTAPTQPLEVNGNTKVDGTLTVSGTGGLNVATGGILFPDGTLQTTAYPASSSGGSAPISVVNNPTENENEAEFNGGVSSNGSGIKHVRTDAGCTTPDHPDQTCTIQVSWPGTPFADTNYTVTCTPKTVVLGQNSGNGIGSYIYIRDQDKTITGVTVTVISATGNGQVNGLNCIAIHD